MMTMEEASGSTVKSLAEVETRGESSTLFRARRVAVETEEWIPPQRSLSEEMMIKSLLGVGLSEGTWAKTSVQVMSGRNK